MGVLVRSCSQVLSISRIVGSRSRRLSLFTSLSSDVSNSDHMSNGDLQQLLEKKKSLIFKQFAGRHTSPQAAFANNDISLRYIDVYGFDFDYTLIQYTEELLSLIYDRARNHLINKLSYPSDIKQFKYSPGFVIRGLHLDIEAGLLMKMDSNHHIQLGSVYRGKTLVTNSEVIEKYGGTHVPIYIMDDRQHRTGMETQPRLIQFLDKFSIAEMSLVVDVSEFLIDKGIPFDPEYLYRDVQNSVQDVHHWSEVHNSVVSNPERFITKAPGVAKLLTQLKDAGKKMFLLTNSPFWFVDHGMKFVTGDDEWMKWFDVVVTSARKPKFYSNTNRPFRQLNLNTLIPKWQRVTQFSPGLVYREGNIKQFLTFTGWRGDNVMYFGDHVYSDLADPSLHLGWKTGAIIPEMEAEICTLNSVEYKESLAGLLAVEAMLKMYQNTASASIVSEWKTERRETRLRLKQMYNPYFGSVFRTEKAPTYYSRRLGRFASLYMSSIESLLEYGLDYTFYPRRASLPHELDLNFDLDNIS